MDNTVKEAQEGVQGQPLALTRDENQIMSSIRHRAYSGRRVTKTELRKYYEVKMSDRAIRRVVESLIIKHRKPIGSSSSKKNGGYFLIRTKDQRDEARGEIFSRIKALAIKAAAIDDITLEAVYRQLPLFERGK